MTNQTKEIIKKITQKCIAFLTALALLFTLSCSDSTSSDDSQSGANPPNVNVPDDSNSPDDNSILQAYLKASNTDAGDEFGYSVALSDDGTTLAVGTRFESGSGTGVNPADNNNEADAGAVYVYTRSGDTWANPVYVKASNPSAGDFFGHSVALSSDGNTLAVGAPFEDSSGNGVLNSGAVYVYSRTDNNWSNPAYVKASNFGAGDEFGHSVALSADGSTLAVGARNEDGSGNEVNPTDNNNAQDAGAVYVYIRSGNNWGQNAYLKASNSGAGDEFGYSVALSADGSTLAVGAHQEDGSESGVDPADNNNGTDVGAVYVYINNAGNWGNPTYLKASNSDDGDVFGYSVALSGDGNTLAVGARFERGSGTGVNPERNNSTVFSGAVYVYNRSGNIWGNDPFYIKASNTGSIDWFGYSVALSSDGNKLTVGARNEDGNGRGINPADSDDAERAGAAYVYTRTGATWDNELVYVKASNPDANDFFGTSVALSGDGSTLAVGAVGEAGSGREINPDDDNSANSAGAVYVYTGF